MKRIFKFLVLPLIILCSCGGNSNQDKPIDEQIERPEHSYQDFSGDLESMNIDYAKRNDNKMGVEYWWSKSKIVTPNHYLVISPMSEYTRLSGMTAYNGSVDYMSLTSFYFNDGAFNDALRLAMIDYDYRQVYIYHSKPGNVSNDEYPVILKNLFKEIKKYSPQVEIYYMASIQSDADIVTSLDEDKVIVKLIKQSEAKTAIQICIDECKNEVPSNKRETDNYALNSREPIEWSKIYFTNPSTFGNKNKRILHIGASVMFATYSHLVEQAPEYNIDCYCSSRGTNDIACAREIEFILRQYKYDGIHLNGTSHVKSQTQAECYASSSALVNLFKLAEPDAKILLSNSTPKGSLTDLTTFSDALSQDILDMALALLKISEEQNLPYDDLYNFAKDNKFVRIDAIHYSSSGVEYPKLGKEVARFFKEYVK